MAVRKTLKKKVNNNLINIEIVMNGFILKETGKKAKRNTRIDVGVFNWLKETYDYDATAEIRDMYEVEKGDQYKIIYILTDNTAILIYGCTGKKYIKAEFSSLE